VNVELCVAGRDQAAILANLMELYVYEFSDISDRDLGPDGRFGYRHLEAYWQEPGRYPFLLRVDGALAGFALVLERGIVDPGEPGHLVAEFFVLRAYRKRGVGEAAAVHLFRKFPGRWWIAEHEANTPAQAFWRRVIGRYTGGSYREERRDLDGELALVQTFGT